MEAIDSHKLSIAPMLDVTDVYFRFLIRLISKRAFLYTEMVNANTIIYSPNISSLKFYPYEHPIAVQLGGSDPDILAKAAEICEKKGFDEININCGCPSPKVQEGSFGAVLMKTPELVAEICVQIKQKVKIPVTIKCRLGVDNNDTFEELINFINIVSTKGQIKHFIIHARKALLKGLNPRENRSVPPLKYDWVLKLKLTFPHLDFSINGGFLTVESIINILKPENKLKGCMIGRMALNNPYSLRCLDSIIFGDNHKILFKKSILNKYIEFAMNEQKNYSVSCSILLKPLNYLYAGHRGATTFRKCLHENSNKPLYKENVKMLIEMAYNNMRIERKKGDVNVQIIANPIVETESKEDFEEKDDK